MVKGKRYRFKYSDQEKILIYKGFNLSGNGYWHQFELESEPGKVWCELQPDDLMLLEAVEEEENAECEKQVS